MPARVTPAAICSVMVTLPAGSASGAVQIGTLAVPAATDVVPPVLRLKVKTWPTATSSPAILQISRNPRLGVGVTVGVDVEVEVRAISVGDTAAVAVGVFVFVAVLVGTDVLVLVGAAV